MTKTDTDMLRHLGAENCKIFKGLMILTQAKSMITYKLNTRKAKTGFCCEFKVSLCYAFN